MQRNRLVALMIFSLLVVTGCRHAKQADLNGRWVSESTSDDGNKTQIVLVIKQAGTAFSGRILFSWGGLNFSGGKIDGSHVQFDVMTPADSQQPAHYEGSLVEGQLHLDSHWPANNNTSLVAVRGSETAGDPPERLPLPELHRVPANGLALTPPMGWNSWNHLQGKVDDASVRAAADAMVSSGMRDAGYRYINIDDTWEGSRDAEGFIHSNRKFPDMKALADYVHGKGLKLGIYSSPGPKTCAGYEGSYGHEAQDAQTYAAWGIDYLKYDFCSAGMIYGKEDNQALYQKMGDALVASGRPIVYSLCQYGMADVWKWGQEVGANLWRTTGDISDSWASLEEIGFSQSDLAPYAGPGHWNDPDMLEIGNGGMNDDEDRTHMTLWALLGAPLLAGNDLGAMSPATRAILTNRDVIAIDQDRAGKTATRVSEKAGLEVWMRPLGDGSKAIGVFNRTGKAQGVDLKWSDFGFRQASLVRDLWSGDKLQDARAGYVGSVPSHGARLLKVKAAGR